MAAGRKVVRDSAAFALSQYIARAVLMARGVIAAAVLGPAGYGGWNALNLIFDYGSYASLGAVQGLDLKLPAAAREPARARSLMAGAWSMVLHGGALLTAGVVLELAIRRPAIGEWGPVVLMLAATLLQLAFQYLASSLRAYGRFDAVSAGHAIQAVLGAGVGIALVWPMGVWGLLLGWLIGSGAALAWMRRAGPEIPLRPSRWADGLPLARVGLPIFGFFAASLLLRSLDRLAFVTFGATEALGLYSLGLMASGLVLYVPEAVGFVLFPRIASAHQGGRDPVATRRDVMRAQRGLLVLLPLAVGLGMVWSGPVVIHLLPRFRDGLAALRVLAVGATLLSSAIIPAYYLLGTGRQGRMLWIVAGAALATSLLVFNVAANDPQPSAVARAAVTGYALYTAAMVALAALDLNLGARERVTFILTSLVPPVWGAAVALAACSTLSGETVLTALARSAVVIVAYAPALWWFGRGIGLKTLALEWVAARPAA